MLSLISQLTSPTLTGTDKSRSVHIENYSFPVTPNSMIKDYHLISALTRPRHQIINIYHGIMVVNENKSVINMKHVCPCPCMFHLLSEKRTRRGALI